MSHNKNSDLPKQIHQSETKNIENTKKPGLSFSLKSSNPPLKKEWLNYYNDDYIVNSKKNRVNINNRFYNPEDFGSVKLAMFGNVITFEDNKDQEKVDLKKNNSKKENINSGLHNKQNSNGSLSSNMLRYSQEGVEIQNNANDNSIDDNTTDKNFKFPDEIKNLQLERVVVEQRCNTCPSKEILHERILGSLDLENDVKGGTIQVNNKVFNNLNFPQNKKQSPLVLNDNVDANINNSNLNISHNNSNNGKNFFQLASESFNFDNNDNNENDVNNSNFINENKEEVYKHNINYGENISIDEGSKTQTLINKQTPTSNEIENNNNFLNNYSNLVHNSKRTCSPIEEVKEELIDTPQRSPVYQSHASNKEKNCKVSENENSNDNSKHNSINFNMIKENMDNEIKSSVNNNSTRNNKDEVITKQQNSLKNIFEQFSKSEQSYVIDTNKINNNDYADKINNTGGVCQSNDNLSINKLYDYNSWKPKPIINSLNLNSDQNKDIIKENNNNKEVDINYNSNKDRMKNSHISNDSNYNFTNMTNKFEEDDLKTSYPESFANNKSALQEKMLQLKLQNKILLEDNKNLSQIITKIKENSTNNSNISIQNKSLEKKTKNNEGNINNISNDYYNNSQISDINKYNQSFYNRKLDLPMKLPTNILVKTNNNEDVNDREIDNDVCKDLPSNNKNKYENRINITHPKTLNQAILQNMKNELFSSCENEFDDEERYINNTYKGKRSEIEKIVNVSPKIDCGKEDELYDFEYIDNIDLNNNDNKEKRELKANKRNDNNEVIANVNDKKLQHIKDNLYNENYNIYNMNNIIDNFDQESNEYSNDNNNNENDLKELYNDSNLKNNKKKYISYIANYIPEEKNKYTKLYLKQKALQETTLKLIDPIAFKNLDTCCKKDHFKDNNNGYYANDSLNNNNYNRSDYISNKISNKAFIPSLKTERPFVFSNNYNSDNSTNSSILKFSNTNTNNSMFSSGNNKRNLSGLNMYYKNKNLNSNNTIYIHNNTTISNYNINSTSNYINNSNNSSYNYNKNMPFNPHYKPTNKSATSNIDSSNINNKNKNIMIINQENSMNNKALISTNSAFPNFQNYNNQYINYSEALSPQNNSCIISRLEEISEKGETEENYNTNNTYSKQALDNLNKFREMNNQIRTNLDVNLPTKKYRKKEMEQLENCLKNFSKQIEEESTSLASKKNNDNNQDMDQLSHRVSGKNNGSSRHSVSNYNNSNMGKLDFNKLDKPVNDSSRKGKSFMRSNTSKDIALHNQAIRKSVVGLSQINEEKIKNTKSNYENNTTRLKESNSPLKLNLKNNNDSNTNRNENIALFENIKVPSKQQTKLDIINEKDKVDHHISNKINIVYNSNNSKNEDLNTNSRLNSSKNDFFGGIGSGKAELNKSNSGRSLAYLIDRHQIKENLKNYISKKNNFVKL